MNLKRPNERYGQSEHCFRYSEALPTLLQELPRWVGGVLILPPKNPGEWSILLGFGNTFPKRLKSYRGATIPLEADCH